MNRKLDVALAVAAALVSHTAFAIAVSWMAISLALGLQSSYGNLPEPWSHVGNASLALQFPLLHSWLLTRRGRTSLARLLPGGRGRTLSPSSYATIASLQLIAVFALWTPSGVVWWQPRGTMQIPAWAAFVASWLFLMRALADGNLGLQTGAVGWWALLRGRRPDFGSMPQGGLFRHCRQPIYLGFLLVLWTGPTRSADQLILALIWTPYCLLGPMLKERRFLTVFGAEFAAYRARVPYFNPAFDYREAHRGQMRIASVAESLPPYRHSQAEITARLKGLWGGDASLTSRLDSLHESVQVRERHLALPLSAYGSLGTFGQVNDVWIAKALELGEAAVSKALTNAGLQPTDVDAIFFSTVTGLASPSIDARLANRLGFRSDIKRVPMFGLGCVAGAAAVSRAADYVRAYPGQVALVLTVELCSLTLQLGDRSVANLISTGLFGDGATAAVVVGAERSEPGPEIVATRSVFYPDTEDVMGWEISEHGFRIVLSARVPTVAREQLPADVDEFLRDHRLQRADIGTWICHPGGPKVLQGLQDGLDLPDEAVAASWEMLARYGNLSSASVLLVLQRALADAPPSGSHGLMLAMGPGFCSELLLLRW